MREKEREGALTWIEEDRRSDAPEPAQQLVQRTYRARKRKNVSYCHVLRPFPESLGSPCSEIAHVVAVSSLDPCGCRLLLYPSTIQATQISGEPETDGPLTVSRSAYSLSAHVQEERTRRERTSIMFCAVFGSNFFAIFVYVLLKVLLRYKALSRSLNDRV